MDRRSFLAGIAVSAVGIGGWQFKDEIGSMYENEFGPPKTETPIKQVGGDDFLTGFTLYESGAAKVEFAGDYGCYSRIAVGDTMNLRTSNLGVWELPKDGELVLDMRAAVSDTRDPSTSFHLGSIGSESTHCYGLNGVSKSFTVPQDWLES